MIRRALRRVWSRGEAARPRPPYPARMDADPLFEHIAREAAARGRAPGWRVSPPRGGSRLFSDRDHGSPGGALDAALAWRDEQLDPRSHVPLPGRRVTLAPGIYLVTQRARGREYPVLRAEVLDEHGKPRVLARSLLKHAPEDALREAAEHRFFHRDTARISHASADALHRDALQAYRAFVAEHRAESPGGE